MTCPGSSQYAKRATKDYIYFRADEVGIGLTALRFFSDLPVMGLAPGSYGA